MESTEKIYVHKGGNGVATAGLVTGVAALAGVAAKWIGNLIDGGGPVAFRHHGHGFGHEGGERFGKLESDVQKNERITQLEIQLAAERSQKNVEVLAVKSETLIRGLEAQIQRLGSYITVTPAFATAAPGLAPEPVVVP